MTSAQKTLRAVIQMVHQAHHEGPLESCPKSTCSAARAELAEATGWTPFERGSFANASPDLLAALTSLHADDCEVWLNSRYQVTKSLVSPPGAAACWHLSIKRRDRAPIHDWRDLQRIKNELVDPEAEAVELYPAESRLVDTANQYHLFTFPLGHILPFGFDERMVSEDPGGGAVQRPFELKPADARSREQLAWELKKATKRAQKKGCRR